MNELDTFELFIEPINAFFNNGKLKSSEAFKLIFSDILIDKIT